MAPGRPIRDEDRKYLEETGVENVRIALLTNTHLRIDDRGAAWRWLKEEDETRQKSQDNVAKKTLIYTVIAAVAGIVAAVASIWALFK